MASCIDYSRNSFKWMRDPQVGVHKSSVIRPEFSADRRSDRKVSDKSPSDLYSDETRPKTLCRRSASGVHIWARAIPDPTELLSPMHYCALLLCSSVCLLFMLLSQTPSPVMHACWVIFFSSTLLFNGSHLLPLLVRRRCLTFTFFLACRCMHFLTRPPPERTRPPPERTDHRPPESSTVGDRERW